MSKALKLSDFPSDVLRSLHQTLEAKYPDAVIEQPSQLTGEKILDIAFKAGQASVVRDIGNIIKNRKEGE